MRQPQVMVRISANDSALNQVLRRSRGQLGAYAAGIRGQVGGQLAGATAMATGLDRELTKAERRVESFSERMRRLASNRFAQAVGVGALSGFTAVGVRASAELESLEMGLEAVAGSAQAADRQLVRLIDLAKLPGIGFQEAIQGSVRLQAVGFSAQFAERTLKAFANAIALTGGGREELRSVQVQLGQLASKGKILAQDLRPIIEAAPAVGRALRNAFGTVDSESIEKLGLSTGEFLEVLLTELEKLPKVSGSAKTSLENLGDAAFRASAAVGGLIMPQVLAGAEKLTSVLEDTRSVTAAVAATAKGVLGGALAFLVVSTGRTAVGFIQQTGAALEAARAQRQLAATNLQGATAQMQMARTMARATGDMTFFREAAANARNAQISLTAATRASSLAAMAGAGAWAALRGAVGFLLSPMGIAITTAGILAYQIFQSAKAAREATAEIDALKSSLAGLSEFELTTRFAAASGKQRFYRGEVARLESEMSAARLAVDSASQSGSAQDLADAMRGSDAIREQLNEAREKAREASQEFREVTRALTDLRMAGANAMGDFSDGVDEVSKKLERLLEQARAGFLGFLDQQAIRAALDQIPMLAALGNRSARAQLAGVPRTRFDHTTGRQVMPNAPTGGMRLTPVAVAASAGPSLGQRVAGMAGLARQGAGGALEGLKSSALSLVSAFNPLGILATIFGKALESLAPALEPLVNIVGRVGGILGKALMPILEALWPVFKLTVIAATYVGQVFFNIAGGILTAVGWLIKGIGKAVDMLPFVSGKNIIKAGEGMMEMGKGFLEGAGALAAARDEIKGLDWEGAIKPLQDAAREAAYNLSDAFDLAYRRNQVAGGSLPASVTGTGSRAPVQVHTQDTYNITVPAEPGEDPRTFARRLMEAVREVRRSGETTDLHLLVYDAAGGRA